MRTWKSRIIVIIGVFLGVLATAWILISLKNPIRRTGLHTFSINLESVKLEDADILKRLTDANVTPMWPKGGKGFQVHGIPTASLLRRLDIRDGDNILKCNGRDVTGVPDLASIINQSLEEKKTIVVDLLRDNQPIQYTYEIH